MLQKIRTVLIHNSHPGNIGSSARAMKNMGLENLYLVAPKRFPAKEAFYMASRADDIVERAIVVDTVQQALEGCTLILGASSRRRALQWHETSPKAAAQKIIQELKVPQNQVAILYGCEQSGLSNEDLALTQYQIVIPAVPEYASLNVAQAVQLISYEIYVAYLDQGERECVATRSPEEEREFVTPLSSQGREGRVRGETAVATILAKDTSLATFTEMESFYHHLEETLLKIQFLDAKQPGLMMSRLRRLFATARLDQTELHILRGILTAIQKQV